jgi:hypothetical protein
MEMRLQDPASPDASGRTNTDATSAALPVSASAAQRKVTRFVVTEISTQLLGETPVFQPGVPSSWVVPVMLSSPSRGIVGKVGEIAVDSRTGELLVDPDTVRRMSEDARQLAERSPL